MKLSYLTENNRADAIRRANQLIADVEGRYANPPIDELHAAITLVHYHTLFLELCADLRKASDRT